ncbi:MAG: YbhB/YbcL family Raf kinase inhibitor-like protein [Sedimentisphaerales bacterium]|nr:YbhB/YbcL family Raf kinase inhibitor-like protein [Sedimentisphaerales bacterium]
MKLQSSAFAPGAPIPQKYTGEGTDVSIPLTWSGVPDGTVELALICDDPDAPRPQPWVHWVIYNIPPTTTSLPESIPRQSELAEPQGALQGVNSWTEDNVGYRGPTPPPGHGVHHYHFRFYALDTALQAEPGLSKDELLAAMEGHIIAQAELVGTYQR